MVSLAQLARKFDLLLLFLTPLNIFRGLLFVLVPLTFIPFVLFPIGLLIALLGRLC